MKVILAYGKNHEVGTWTIALGKNPSRWLLSAFPSLGPVDVNALVSAQSILCWPPTALNVSFVCAVIVCGFLGTVFKTSVTTVSIHGQQWLDFSTWFWRSECMTRVENTALWYLSMFCCKRERTSCISDSVELCHRWTHAHMQACSILWMLNFNLSWTFVIPLTCAEQI